jgi:chemotaxis protein MotB
MAAEEDGAPIGAPEWMVTYSDMISLLVTFFILLMTFSTPANDNNFPISGDLSGAGGMMGKDNWSSAVPPEDDIMAAMDARRGADVPHTRPADQLPDNLEQMGQRLREGEIEINFRGVHDGIVLHFGEEATFSPGSDEVPAALDRALREVADVLEHYAFLIVVEGFTDTSFKASPSHPSAEAMSAARAYAAARVMLEHSHLSPKLVQIAGLGTKRPLNDNASASQRRLNRRVEIRIVSLSRLRAASLAADGEEG